LRIDHGEGALTCGKLPIFSLSTRWTHDRTFAVGSPHWKQC
jgi:hypothetical protein